MGKVLALDLDGTLFYPRGHKRLVSKKNKDFIKRFINEGNKVVLVSSRTSDFCEKVLDELQLPIDYIALTGSIIKADGVVMQDLSIPNDNLKSILKGIRRQYKPIAFILTCKGQPLILKAFIKVGKLLEKGYLFWYKMAFGIYREQFVADAKLFRKELESGTLYSVKCFFGFGKKNNKLTKQINKEIIEKYPSIESSWLGIALEISPHGCNKGDALKTYLKFIKHENNNDVYVVGDSGNDITMFKAFKETSFVMSHAYPSVKKYASHKISRVYKLDKYLLERSQNE